MSLAALGLLLTTGCTIKATLKQITDTTSNVTATTSGAAWWGEDGQIKPDFKAAAFAAINHRNLQQDIATGRGEYLASMSVLLGVPEERQNAFFSAAQAGYARAGGGASLELETLLPFLRNTAAASLQ
jgi:hypothetical protein